MSALFREHYIGKFSREPSVHLTFSGGGLWRPTRQGDKSQRKKRKKFDVDIINLRVSRGCTGFSYTEVFPRCLNELRGVGCPFLVNWAATAGIFQSTTWTNVRSSEEDLDDFRLQPRRIEDIRREEHSRNALVQNEPSLSLATTRPRFRFRLCPALLLGVVRSELAGKINESSLITQWIINWLNEYNTMKL